MFEGTPIPGREPAPRGPDAPGFRQRAGGPVVFRPTPCGHCGYDLIGLPQHGVCPECGTQIGEDAPRSEKARKLEKAKLEAQQPHKSVCHACGYDLAGLDPGAVCPECGTPSLHGIKGAARDCLGDAEPSYLATLASGLVLAAVSGLVYAWIALFANLAFSSIPALATSIAAAAIGWLAGVVLLLRQRPGGGRDRDLDARGREWWPLRLFIFATQSLALVACAVEVLDILTAAAAAAPTPGFLARFAWTGWQRLDWMLSVAAVIGWPPLCYYLARLADWAPDDTLARWLRHTGSFIGVGILVAGIALVARQIAPFRILFFFSAALLLVFPLACLAMLLLMLRFAWAVRWARVNTIERYERDARMAARARQRAEEMAARSLRATGEDRPPAPVIDNALLGRIEAAHNAAAARAPLSGEPWSEEDLEAQRRASTAAHRLEPSKDRAGYALEGDENPLSPRP